MKKILLTITFTLFITCIFSNTFFQNFKDKNLHDATIPYENFSNSELIQVSDALFYTVKDETSEGITLKLAGIYTECISAAKFCLREAANNFVKNLLDACDSETIYFIRETDSDDALVWIKYEEDYYLLNLMLLFYDYAFIEGETEMIEPYLLRYDQIDIEEETGMKNILGDND